MPQIVGMIPARYASSRFPGKPLASIAGKTLLQRCYENVWQCPVIDAIVIATDDERIAAHARSFGAEVVLTPTSCRTGSERAAEALKKLPQYSNAEIVVNIQGDEPFLEPEVISKVIASLKKNPGTVVGTAVTELHDQKALRDLSIVKCVRSLSGEALFFSRNPIPARSASTPPTYYRHLGIYSFRRAFLERLPTLQDTPLQLAEDLEQLKILEHGYRIATVLVESNSIGIDEPKDLQHAEKRVSL